MKRRKKVFTAGMVAAFLACCSVPVSADPAVLFDSAEKALTLDGVVAVSDYVGAGAALFEFTYTNKTSAAKMPAADCFVSVYQGGVSLQSTVITDPNYAGLVAAGVTQVKDGASVSYAMAYKLNDLTSDLEVEVRDSIVGGNVQSFVIPVSNSAAETKPPEDAPVDWEAKYNELLAQYELLNSQYQALLEEVNAE